MIYFYLVSYIALITLAIESSKDGKMTLNGKLSNTLILFLKLLIISVIRNL